MDNLTNAERIGIRLDALDRVVAFSARSTQPYDEITILRVALRLEAYLLYGADWAEHCKES